MLTPNPVLEWAREEADPHRLVPVAAGHSAPLRYAAEELVE